VALGSLKFKHSKTECFKFQWEREALHAPTLVAFGQSILASVYPTFQTDMAHSLD